MMSIGLLGAGRIGTLHGRNIAANPKARLVAIADAVPAPAEALGRELGVPVRSVDEIIADPAIQALVVCSSTDTHAELIEAGARAGKAVFCEKPVDLSSERIRACLAVVEKAGTPLMIGFNRRFDPHFGALQARLAAGEIGDVELVTILSRDPGPPPLAYIARSGGLYRDMMIHDFDMARFLLGEEPVEVHAVGSSLVDPEIGRAGDVDTAAVLLKTASGKICPDLELAPRHLRLRPAHRGAWREGHAARPQSHRACGRGRERRGLCQRARAELLPRALYARLSPRARPLPGEPRGRHGALALRT